MRDLRQWAELLERELTENIIPFWVRYSIDREYGGYLTCLERDGQVYDGMKQMWMQWREVYMFAALCNSRFRKEEYLALADQGFEFLRRHGVRADGSYAYMLDRKGNVLADKADGAEVFTGSFAAVAASMGATPLAIPGADAVNKSQPGFFADFAVLGGEYRKI